MPMNRSRDSYWQREKFKWVSDHRLEIPLVRICKFYGGDDGFFGLDNNGMSNDDSCGGEDSTPDDGASFSEVEFVGEPDMESDGVCDKTEGYFLFQQELESNGYYLTINFDGSVTTSAGQMILLC